MGVNNFCSVCSYIRSKETFEVNPVSKELRGQYNNFKVFSLFDMYITQKNFNCDCYEIEGVFIDKKGKSEFKGKISRTSINIETRNIFDETMPEYTFEGSYNEVKKKYVGTFNQKTKEDYKGNFWIELLDKTFWKETILAKENSSHSTFMNTSPLEKQQH